MNWEDIVRFISDIQNIELNESNDFIKKLKEKMKLVYFSKFSKCLPNHLLAEALSERSFDFHGLVSEIQNNKIEIMKVGGSNKRINSECKRVSVF